MRTVDHVTIGTLARLAGCSVATIRYYETIGLIPPAARREGGHRVFSDIDRRRLAFIRRCRRLGFPIEQIREFTSLARNRGGDCGAARAIAQRQLGEVRRRRRELHCLEREIRRMVDECSARCAGGPVEDCTILADLAARGPPCRAARVAAPRTVRRT
jgi:DNA-binding transcriptional MerR regulator